MKWYRWFILAGVVVVSAFVAIQMSGVVYAMIVLPVSYLFWLLKLVYHALPGVIWWILLALVVFYLLVISLLPGIKFAKKTVPPLRPLRGSVENLAVWAEKSKRGTYFKWLVANRLGKIAHQILESRAAGKKRYFFDPLTGPDWNPSAGVHSYLKAGLQNSFADFPRSDSYFKTPMKTHLDHDVMEVIEYLETQADEQQSAGRF